MWLAGYNKPSFVQAREISDPMDARPTSTIYVRSPQYDDSQQTVQVVAATHTARTRGYHP